MPATEMRAALRPTPGQPGVLVVETEKMPSNRRCKCQWKPGRELWNGTVLNLNYNKLIHNLNSDLMHYTYIYIYIYIYTRTCIYNKLNKLFKILRMRVVFSLLFQKKTPEPQLSYQFVMEQDCQSHTGAWGRDGVLKAWRTRWLRSFNRMMDEIQILK